MVPSAGRDPLRRPRLMQIPTGVAANQTLTDFVDIEWPFRDEYNRRTTGKTRMCRNPTTVATHDFHHHHTVMRFSGGCNRSIASVAI